MRTIRSYSPSLRCLVAGSGPIAVSLAELAALSGFTTDFYVPDLEALPALPPHVNAYPLLPRTSFAVDSWTAAAIAFHDHEQELPVFRELLRSSCFFITSIGSRNAHAARKLALENAGFSDAEIARIQNPAGLVPGLKSAPSIALSILTQIVSAAHERHIIS
ncbi:MAG: XdhC family protein [Rhodomicrobium sp.]|nr:XdhC family protein [Rhodomicrobium sp.]